MGGGITGPENFIDEFYQKFQEELRPILLRLIQKIREEGKLPHSFYEATITITPKPDKNVTHTHTHTHTHKYRPATLMNIDAKNSEQNLSKPNITTYLERLYNTTKWALSLGSKDSLIFTNQCNTAH